MAVKKNKWNGNEKSGKDGNPASKWLVVGLVILLLWILSMVIAAGLSLYFGADIDLESKVGQGNIAIIPIKGEIASEKPNMLFVQEGTSSTKTIQFIKAAEKDPSVRAIIFDINSPGGSAVASEEIAHAIKESTKYKVAVIRDLGASGAYWIASSSDVIFASRMSLTGSIGVISSFIQFEGLMDKYGISYERLVAGERKDIGSPFREMTDEERILFQKKINTIHEYFINEVAENRNLSSNARKAIADGSFFLGSEAKEHGLIDEIGNKDDAIRFIERQLNITAKPVEYKEKTGFLSNFVDAMSKPSFFMGQGIGYALKDVNTESDIGIKT